MRLIQLNGNYYKVVKSSQIIDNTEGYNKLVINNVQTSDSGKYICLAANSQGYAFKEASLTVKNDPILNQDIHSHFSSITQSSKLFWAFLIVTSIVVFILTCLLMMAKKDHNHIADVKKISNKQNANNDYYENSNKRLLKNNQPFIPKSDSTYQHFGIGSDENTSKCSFQTKNSRHSQNE